MANYIETPMLYNSTNSGIGKIFKQSAVYDDTRDTKLYGIARVGGSAFSSKNDVNQYLKKITQVSPAMTGSAQYKGKGMTAGWSYKGQKLGLARSIGVKKKEYGKPYSNKGKTPPQLQPWLDLVAKVKLENPNLAYREILQKAKEIKDKSK